jgi:uncharacterized protein YecT (DUF1311 family)
VPGAFFDHKDKPVKLRAPASIVMAATICFVSSCGIYHTRAYVPNSFTSLRTEDAATASTNCFESATPVEKAACAVPALALANRLLTETLQQDLRRADPFSRDALMAFQRAWLLGLPAQCHMPQAAAASPDAAPPGAASIACLSQSFASQTATLAAWSPPPHPGGGRDALAQYVRFAPAHAFGADGRFCAALAQAANVSLGERGTVDPAHFPGATEIAGSHGAPSGQAGGHRYAVAMQFANAYGGFDQRARDITIDGAAPVLDAVALGQALQAAVENNGARFSAYASQTGDYGAIDVFAQNGRVIALLEDAWGFDTPAAPGEFAHAGAWDISSGVAAPLCLFDTFKMPAENGVFDTLPSFMQFRTLLGQIRESAEPAAGVASLGVATLRDQSQLRARTEWMLLNMPLLVSQQARAGGWTPWLRTRHDEVLDALFAWSTRAPANKALFDQLFALLRPAAGDLALAYQQSQALSGKEAQEATGIAIMELLYGATTSIAPDLGGDLAAPGSAAGRKPRYPILAVPS